MAIRMGVRDSECSQESPGSGDGGMEGQDQEPGWFSQPAHKDTVSDLLSTVVVTKMIKT